MERAITEGSVGVIVGRFQVPYLHDAHCDLIETVIEERSRVIICLGISPAMVTRRNPLDFEARKQMILQDYPDVTIIPIMDVQSNDQWSANLDKAVSEILTPREKAVLYGSRDSFIAHYTGKFPTEELVPDHMVSGTDLRKISSERVKCSQEFRDGVIWAANNQFPKTWICVDVAILNSFGTQVLLGRKPTERKFRFIGGFVDPTDESLEAAAIREAHEEAGQLELTAPKYICSMLTNDWRYRSEVDKITTSLFVTSVVFGSPIAGDDIEEVKWFDLDEFKSDLEYKIVEGHIPLMEKLINHMETR